MPEPKLKLIRFSMPGCAVCRQMDKSRILEKFEVEHPTVKIVERELPVPDEDDDDEVDDELDPETIKELITCLECDQAKGHSEQCKLTEHGRANLDRRRKDYGTASGVTDWDLYGISRVPLLVFEDTAGKEWNRREGAITLDELEEWYAVTVRQVRAQMAR